MKCPSMDSWGEVEHLLYALYKMIRRLRRIPFILNDMKEVISKGENVLFTEVMRYFMKYIKRYLLKWVIYNSDVFIPCIMVFLVLLYFIFKILFCLMRRIKNTTPMTFIRALLILIVSIVFANLF